MGKYTHNSNYDTEEQISLVQYMVKKNNGKGWNVPMTLTTV